MANIVNKKDMYNPYVNVKLSPNDIIELTLIYIKIYRDRDCYHSNDTYFENKFKIFIKNIKVKTLIKEMNVKGGDAGEIIDFFKYEYKK
ncbi:MAG: hypothetical protein WC656_04970 [Sulfurimonas sp.]|jgi:hypothetical protein